MRLTARCLAFGTTAHILTSSPHSAQVARDRRASHARANWHVTLPDYPPNFFFFCFVFLDPEHSTTYLQAAGAKQYSLWTTKQKGINLAIDADSTVATVLLRTRTSPPAV